MIHIPKTAAEINTYAALSRYIKSKRVNQSTTDSFIRLLKDSKLYISSTERLNSLEFASDSLGTKDRFERFASNIGILWTGPEDDISPYYFQWLPTDKLGDGLSDRIMEMKGDKERTLWTDIEKKLAEDPDVPEGFVPWSRLRYT